MSNEEHNHKSQGKNPFLIHIPEKKIRPLVALYSPLPIKKIYFIVLRSQGWYAHICVRDLHSFLLYQSKIQLRGGRGGGG